ncbi:hypothetical protein B0J14DRAFT_635343 [Halenospora varia]|nr:hypothetical protein B0J14DRAFT_635343 [Halenospora varia]
MVGFAGCALLFNVIICLLTGAKMGSVYFVESKVYQEIKILSEKTNNQKAWLVFYKPEMGLLFTQIHAFPRIRKANNASRVISAICAILDIYCLWDNARIKPKTRKTISGVERQMEGTEEVQQIETVELSDAPQRSLPRASARTNWEVAESPRLRSPPHTRRNQEARVPSPQPSALAGAGTRNQ